LKTTSGFQANRGQAQLGCNLAGLGASPGWIGFI
jgi:hypothetical protein